MTFGELKSIIADLGYEELSAVDVNGEYETVCVNAINRASSLIYATVIFPYKEALASLMQLNEKPTVVTSSTDDSTDMRIAPLLEALLPLLAGHYVWLDDDLTKATVYWNEYDDMKNQILNTISKKTKSSIVGGF